MAIYSMRKESDPRVVCGLLAQEALKDIEGPSDAAPDKAQAFLTNLLRLLEVYRYDVFIGRKPRGVLERSQNSRAKRSADAESRYGDVRKAMEAAHQDVFGATPKIDAIDTLTRSLISIRDRNPEKASKEDLEQTKMFLESLLRHIQEYFTN